MKCDEISKNAICPFYQQTIRTNKNQFVGIQCEPLMDEPKLGFSTSHIVRLANKELNDYAEIFCKNAWEDCPYAKALQLIKYQWTG